MNWDALGAIAELIAAIAVLISLIYLAIQVRVGTQQIRASQENDRLMQELASNDYPNQIRFLIASDPELADIELRGIHDLSSLTPVERRRFDEVLVSMIWSSHKFFQQQKASGIAVDFVSAVQPAMKRKYAGAGFFAWWKEHRAEFADPDFQDIMDAVVSRLENEHDGKQPLG